MTTKQLYKIADEIAPKALSDEYCEKYGAYDNSGILVDTGEDIKKAVFSLDLSQGALQRALQEGANAIVTHHPAIYGKISDIRVDDIPLGEKLITCIKNGISVIAMHLNLDCVDGGIDESLQHAVLCACGTETTQTTVMHPLSKGGYGRVYTVNETPLQTLADNLGKTLNSTRIQVYNGNKTSINRVASFCGAGVDEQTLAFAKAQGADVIVSSDFKHHFIAQALELGLSVVVLTHYASEQYGFKKYYENIRQKTDVACIYHVDETLL